MFGKLLNEERTPTIFIGSDKSLIIFYKFGPIRGGLRTGVLGKI